THTLRRPVAVLRQVEPPRVRPALRLPGTAKDLEQVDVLDAVLFQLIEQAARPFADDDPRVFRPPGEHPGIDALLVGHRNDQQPNPTRLELVAERSDRGQRVGGLAFGSAGLALGEIAYARSIEEPAAAPDNGLLAGIGEEPPL